MQQRAFRLRCRPSFWGASCPCRGLCGTSCHQAITLPAAHFVPAVFLVRSVGHVHKRVTDHLSVTYYVADTFSEEYTGSSLKTVERNVEDDYIANLRNNCWKEKQQSECTCVCMPSCMCSCLRVCARMCASVYLWILVCVLKHGRVGVAALVIAGKGQPGTVPENRKTRLKCCPAPGIVLCQPPYC